MRGDGNINVGGPPLSPASRLPRPSARIKNRSAYGKTKTACAQPMLCRPKSTSMRNAQNAFGRPPEIPVGAGLLANEGVQKYQCWRASAFASKPAPTAFGQNQNRSAYGKTKTACAQPSLRRPRSTSTRNAQNAFGRPPEIPVGAGLLANEGGTEKLMLAAPRFRQQAGFHSLRPESKTDRRMEKPKMPALSQGCVDADHYQRERESPPALPIPVISGKLTASWAWPLCAEFV